MKTINVFSKWDIVFTDPEDPTWHIVSDSSGVYELNHKCDPFNPGDYYLKGCTYCGSEPTDCIRGMFRLVSWREDE